MFRNIIVFTQEEHSTQVFIVNTRGSSRCKNTSIHDINSIIFIFNKNNESQVHKQYHRAELILFYFKRLEIIKI